jgi:chromosome segregation ATPase
MSVDSQVKVLENVVERLDTSIEKLTEVSNSIGRLLAVHDERINTLEKVHSRQEDDIRDLHSRITSISKDICSKLDEVEHSLENKMKDYSDTSEKMHKELKSELQSKLYQLDKRINLLENWRWIILGGAAVVAFIGNKLIDLFN